MTISDLTDEIERVRVSLEHRKRSRSSVERAKIHIAHSIEDARRDLDSALQVARRAQIEVEDAQKKFDIEVQRLRKTDQSLEQISDEELELASQLRNLSSQLSKATSREAAASDGNMKNRHLRM